LDWVRLGAGARGRGLEPADPRGAAQCLALRGPTVRPQPDRTRGASLVSQIPAGTGPRVEGPLGWSEWPDLKRRPFRPEARVRRGLAGA
jgi:hypothetical protein